MSRHIPISELAAVLHARANPWKGFAMIWGYFDDAGTHVGSEVTSIGGLVGTADAWAAFEADWNAVIEDFREYGLTAFHACDCEVGDGEFKKFDRPVREAISRRFSRVIAAHTELRPFWSSVVNEAWEELVAVPFLQGADGSEFLERYEKPFGLSFEWIIQQVASWSERYAGGSPVSLVFSEQADFKGRMQEIFNAYLEGKHFAPLRTLTFGSYRDLLPLQGADLVATEINRSWRAAELDGERFKDRPEIVELSKGRGLHLGGCYDRSALANAIKKYRANLAAHEAWLASLNPSRRPPS